MINYLVNQNGVEDPIKRSGKSLTVYDKDNNSYTIREVAGGLEITTIDGDLEVVLKSPNSVTLSAHE